MADFCQPLQPTPTTEHTEPSLKQGQEFFGTSQQAKAPARSLVRCPVDKNSRHLLDCARRENTHTDAPRSALWKRERQPSCPLINFIYYRSEFGSVELCWIHDSSFRGRLYHWDSCELRGRRPLSQHKQTEFR